MTPAGSSLGNVLFALARPSFIVIYNLLQINQLQPTIEPFYVRHNLCLSRAGLDPHTTYPQEGPVGRVRSQYNHYSSLAPPDLDSSHSISWRRMLMAFFEIKALILLVTASVLNKEGMDGP